MAEKAIELLRFAKRTLSRRAFRTMDDPYGALTCDSIRNRAASPCNAMEAFAGQVASVKQTALPAPSEQPRPPRRAYRDRTISAAAEQRVRRGSR